MSPRIEKSASRTRSEVGRVALPAGATSVRPPSRPAITRTPEPDAPGRSKDDLALQAPPRARHRRLEAPTRLRRWRGGLVGSQEIHPCSCRNRPQAEENVLQHLKCRRFATEV